ncbi:MAG: energy transducer TonB [Porticoccus sp.]|nr:energy transducer TonB [Porticoccus sp.]
MLGGRVTSYSIAILVSLALHSFVIFLLVSHWGAEKTPRKAVPPKYVQAKLIQLEEKAKPRPEAKPKPKPKPEVKPKPKPEPKPKPKPKPEVKPKPKPEVKPELKQDSQQLAKDLASALASEEEFLVAENDEQLTSSYSAYIFERVAANWNRPPSARREMEVDLQIQLVPTGQVISVVVIKSSGSGAFDRSAEQAVHKVGRFEKLQELPSRVFEQNFRQLRLVFRPDDLRL